jgi:predicted metal-dependent hydrolase
MSVMPSPLAHPRLSRTLLELAASQERRERCSEPPPPLLVRGIEEFNQREFFECHETLEVLWRSEPHPVRYLYQGILQVGVGFYHLGRGNHHGAVTKLRTGCELLEFYAPRCQGVEVAPLIAAATRARRRLERLGRERMGDFPDELIPRVELVGPHPEPHRGPLPPLPNPKAKESAE